MRRWADLRAGGLFWVGAHRGGRDLGPENTLETAALGYGTGAHFWELDVQLSKDDVPVVMHDDTLERTTNAAAVYPGRNPWRVRDFLGQEIQGLRPLALSRDTRAHRPITPRGPLSRSLSPSEDSPSRRTRSAVAEAHPSDPLSPLGERAGVRGQSPPPSSPRIPTLLEALTFTRALNWPVNVEIKGAPDHHDTLVRETVRLIAALEMHAWVLVSSFHHDVLRRLKTLDPRILTGVLTQETIDDPEALIRAVNADTLHPADGKISEALVRRCRASGIPVIAWTVNDPERLMQLKAWGVSAVITDRPQALMPLIHP